MCTILKAFDCKLFVLNSYRISFQWVSKWWHNFLSQCIRMRQFTNIMSFLLHFISHSFVFIATKNKITYQKHIQLEHEDFGETKKARRRNKKNKSLVYCSLSQTSIFCCCCCCCWWSHKTDESPLRCCYLKCENLLFHWRSFFLLGFFGIFSSCLLFNAFGLRLCRKKDVTHLTTILTACTARTRAPCEGVLWIDGEREKMFSKFKLTSNWISWVLLNLQACAFCVMHNCTAYT